MNLGVAIVFVDLGLVKQRRKCYVLWQRSCEIRGHREHGSMMWPFHHVIRYLQVLLRLLKEPKSLEASFRPFKYIDTTVQWLDSIHSIILTIPTPYIIFLSCQSISQQSICNNANLLWPPTDSLSIQCPHVSFIFITANIIVILSRP